jgi:ketosteroid isomerase-like protein
MPAATPAECDELFETNLNSGDLEGLVALYEPQACLVNQDRTLVRGTDAIRLSFAELLAAHAKSTGHSTRVVQAGEDLAVLYNDWNLTVDGQDGNPISLSHKAIEVVRCQPDRTWMFVIDDPYARG